jgi:hypothetical protein
MELHEAMAQISEIRLRLAQTETFRGYRSATVAGTGSVAFAAGALQLLFLTEPTASPATYLALWIGAAVIAATGTGLEMLLRFRRASDPMTASLTRLAVEQFVPCVMAGGMLTATLALCYPESVGLLPGLWQILFSLGIFSSCRLLPRPTAWAAGFYLVCGVASLAIARGPHTLSPWAMALPFGIGQWLWAGILYWTLERDHGHVEP